MNAARLCGDIGGVLLGYCMKADKTAQALRSRNYLGTNNAGRQLKLSILREFVEKNIN